MNFIHLFVTDAIPGFPFVHPNKFPPMYRTRFDLHRSSLYLNGPFYNPFDISQTKNYSFLFSTLNPWNKENTIMSIPKWYLKSLTEYEKYKNNDSKIAKFFLKIKPINPHDIYNNNSGRDYEIPFWIVEILYNTETDTFESAIRNPQEPLSEKWVNS